jgi:hypothetical protein
MYRLRLDQVFEVFSGTKEDFRHLVECAAEVVIVFELDGGKRGFANGCDPEEIVRDFLADQGRAGFGDTNPNRVGAIYLHALVHDARSSRSAASMSRSKSRSARRSSRDLPIGKRPSEAEIRTWMRRGRGGGQAAQGGGARRPGAKFPLARGVRSG